MSKTAARKTKVPKIKVGHGMKPVKRVSYPFDDLKKPGDYFRVDDIEQDNSVRAQASKQSKIRQVKYSVNRRLTEVKGKEKMVIVVMFDHYL